MALLQKKALERLDALQIPYSMTEHQAVYTIEQMEQLHLNELGHVAKNLFLRDAKGKRHFLVTICGEKQADLKELGAKTGCRLSFASEERLERLLKLKKGAVTPLGVMNDESNTVEVILDSGLRGKERIGVHPCENTATVWLTFDDLCKFITSCGNPLELAGL